MYTYLYNSTVGYLIFDQLGSLLVKFYQPLQLMKPQWVSCLTFKPSLNHTVFDLTIFLVIWYIAKTAKWSKNLSIFSYNLSEPTCGGVHEYTALLGMCQWAVDPPWREEVESGPGPTAEQPRLRTSSRDLKRSRARAFIRVTLNWGQKHDFVL